MINLEVIFVNTGNSKTSEPHRFRLTLADKLNLKDTNKNMVLAILSVYYPWKNFKSAYRNNEFKISAPTWNDKFDLPVDRILFQTFKIVLNESLKNMKL